MIDFDIDEEEFDDTDDEASDGDDSSDVPVVLEPTDNDFEQPDSSHDVNGNHREPSFCGAHWTKDECDSKINEFRREKDYQSAQLRTAMENLEKAARARDVTTSYRYAVENAKSKLAEAIQNIRKWEEEKRYAR